jgi:hypothetical protein
MEWIVEPNCDAIKFDLETGGDRPFQWIKYVQFVKDCEKL